MSSELTVASGKTRAYRRAFIALVVFVLIVSAKVWMVQLFILGGASSDALILDLGFVFVLFSAIDLAMADLRLRSLLVADAAVSAVLVALAVYHAYYGLLPSRQSLALVGQATTVGGSILKLLLNPVYLLLFIEIPPVALWAVRSRRRGIDPIAGCRPGGPIAPGMRTPYVYQRRFVYLAALVVSALLIFSVRATEASPDAMDATAVASKHGVGSYLAVALAGPSESGESLLGEGAKASDFQKRADSLSGHVMGAPLPGFTPGQAKGKNVIIIQVEALQALAVGRSVGSGAVTPNLDELMQGSWYFPNCLSGAGVGTTADVEFVTNTSLYPPIEVGASLGWSDRELTSMPRLLGAQGYDALTFHTNEAGFWNRRQFYPALGFTRYFDKSYFGSEDAMAFKAASDRVLFEKTLPMLTSERDVGRPFYAQLITLSSHFPFENVPASERKLRPGPPYDGTILGNYLTEMHYADEQIGTFISQLKKTGLWDDSIVVVYGDHFGLPEPRNGAESDAFRALTGHDYNDSDRATVPLIVHLPGQTKGTRVTGAVGQIDLAPSLADALDADLSGMLHFGSSVFRSRSGAIAAGGLFESGSYAQESVLYVPGFDFSRGHAFDLSTHTASALSGASETTYENVKQLLLVSRQYVATLPLRKDFDPNAEITFPRKR